MIEPGNTIKCECLVIFLQLCLQILELNTCLENTGRKSKLLGEISMYFELRNALMHEKTKAKPDNELTGSKVFR